MTQHRLPRIVFDVVGTPAPGGSKSAFRHRSTGRIVVVDAGGKRTKDWRAAVAAAGRAAMEGQEPLNPPLALTILFRVPRPASHLNRQGQLRRSSPVYPVSRPDLTKYLRSTEDALTGIAWADDATIVEQWVAKLYAHPSEKPGARITVRELRVSKADSLEWEDE
jgi:Holliday junction resolvase RusA-like endonuclease